MSIGTFTKAIFKEPRNLFLVVGILLVIVSFFAERDSAIDISLHDSYFIISRTHILRVLAGIFSIYYFIYWIFRNITIYRILSWIHLFFTLTGIVILAAQMRFFNTNISASALTHDYFTPSYESFLSIEVVTILLIALGQAIFVVYILIGLFKLLKSLKN